MDSDFREQLQKKCKYRLGAFTGGWREGLFGGGSCLPVFFTVSGFAEIVWASLIHCGGTSCKAVCLNVYNPVASFRPSMSSYGSVVSTLMAVSSFRSTEYKLTTGEA